ncbi:MAG: hypothetical protein M1370_04630 [Bacteroidetes bacterium]|nr:hypothetical protein [Bacteroidota bacterium]MCL5026326.1 hypothetical protein [Chloroflexota bacterium]
MEYLQRALERIIPDNRQIAEEVIQRELFAPHLFVEASLDKDLCMLVDGKGPRDIAFLVERSGGRRRQVMWMPLEAGRPSAVMANYVGSIEYIPAGDYYYQEEAKLRMGIAAAAQRFARLVNNELLMLLCRADHNHNGREGKRRQKGVSAALELLCDELRADGFSPDSLVVPENTSVGELGLVPAQARGLVPCHPRLLGFRPDGTRVWSAMSLKRVMAADTRRLGMAAAGPLRVLLGAHNQRNAYWIIVGRYLNAVVKEPRAIRWARLAS